METASFDLKKKNFTSYWQRHIISLNVSNKERAKFARTSWRISNYHRTSLFDIVLSMSSSWHLIKLLIMSVVISQSNRFLPNDGETVGVILVSWSYFLFFFLEHTLTVLSYSHGDVDFQVRASTYIHMDGIGFLVTGMKSMGGEREPTEQSYMLSNY